GRADLQALDVDLDRGRDAGGLGLDGLRGQLEVEHALGVDVADRDDRDHDRDLLAALAEEELDGLDEALDRVALDALGQRQLVDAVALQADQHVGGAQREEDLVAGEGEVLGVDAVPVEDGGHLLVAADLASGTLAERGARLGDDTYF